MTTSGLTKEQLKPCPFCSGVASFCGQHVGDDEHPCHHIVCSGCGLSADYGAGVDPDTLEELQGLCAAKWNLLV